MRSHQVNMLLSELKGYVMCICISTDTLQLYYPMSVLRD